MGIEQDHSGTTRVEEEARWSNWMVSANAGDADAYAKLLEEIGGVMEQYLRRRFGEGDFIEDCVQECLLAIHNARHTYDPKRPFRPWLFTIVRNRTIDLLRSSYAGKEVSNTPAIDAASQLDGPAEDYAAAQVLVQLEPGQRHALMLTKILGYSLAEAAQYEGVTESAMKSRVARALRAAEDILHSEGLNE